MAEPKISIYPTVTNVKDIFSTTFAIENKYSLGLSNMHLTCLVEDILFDKIAGRYVGLSQLPANMTLVGTNGEMISSLNSGNKATAACDIKIKLGENDREIRQRIMHGEIRIITKYRLNYTPRTLTDTFRFTISKNEDGLYSLVPQPNETQH